MKNFIDELATLITQQEAERLDNIMYEVAKNIQKDVIEVTYSLIDMYYEDYTHEKGRVYIRTDEYKHPHGRYGRFRRKTRAEATSSKANDVSLMTALKDKKGDDPAIGVCRPLDGVFGYQAGVIFDEEELMKKMKHSRMGANFTEWNIVENFLSGVHGNDDVYITTPSADMVLDNYIYSYASRFDKHYNDALRKFNK